MLMRRGSAAVGAGGVLLRASSIKLAASCSSSGQLLDILSWRCQCMGLTVSRTEKAGKFSLIEYLNQRRGEQRHPVYWNVFTSSALLHYLELICLDLMHRATNQALGSAYQL